MAMAANHATRGDEEDEKESSSISNSSRADDSIIEDWGSDLEFFYSRAPLHIFEWFTADMRTSRNEMSRAKKKEADDTDALDENKNDMSISAYISRRLKSGDHHDCLLSFKDHTWPVHTFLLRRSEYFCSKLSRWSHEHASSASDGKHVNISLDTFFVDIEGMNDSVIDRLLSFFYTDRLDIGDDIWLFFELGQILSFSALIDACEVHCRHLINAENIEAVLTIAKRYSMDSLRQSCEEWMLQELCRDNFYTFYDSIDLIEKLAKDFHLLLISRFCKHFTLRTFKTHWDNNAHYSERFNERMIFALHHDAVAFSGPGDRFNHAVCWLLQQQRQTKASKSEQRDGTPSKDGTRKRKREAQGDDAVDPGQDKNEEEEEDDIIMLASNGAQGQAKNTFRLAEEVLSRLNLCHIDPRKLSRILEDRPSLGISNDTIWISEMKWEGKLMYNEFPVPSQILDHHLNRQSKSEENERNKSSKDSLRHRTGPGIAQLSIELKLSNKAQARYTFPLSGDSDPVHIVHGHLSGQFRVHLSETLFGGTKTFLAVEHFSDRVEFTITVGFRKLLCDVDGKHIDWLIPERLIRVSQYPGQRCKAIPLDFTPQDLTRFKIRHDRIVAKVRFLRT